MPQQSAGLLLYRQSGDEVEVLLVHPGGPFWAKKDAGAWTIPKGEIEPGEDPIAAARREFLEETGCKVAGEAVPLGRCRQAGGKLVFAWAVAAEFDPATLISNSFELEWPPRSGERRTFAEVDRAAWFALEEARRHINKAQVAFIDALEALIQAP